MPRQEHFREWNLKERSPDKLIGQNPGRGRTVCNQSVNEGEKFPKESHDTWIELK